MCALFVKRVPDARGCSQESKDSATNALRIVGMSWKSCGSWTIAGTDRRRRTMTRTRPLGAGDRLVRQAKNNGCFAYVTIWRYGNDKSGALLACQGE